LRQTERETVTDRQRDSDRQTEREDFGKRGIDFILMIASVPSAGFLLELTTVRQSPLTLQYVDCDCLCPVERQL
jgi:hypothetical protein